MLLLLLQQPVIRDEVIGQFSQGHLASGDVTSDITHAGGDGFPSQTEDAETLNASLIKSTIGANERGRNDFALG